MKLSPELEKPVRFLRGVGPKRALQFQKLGVETVWDLIHHFPREHEDRAEKVPIGRLQPGTFKTVRGKIDSFEVVPVGPSLAIGKAVLKDDTGYIWAVWFRRTTPRYDVFQSMRERFTKGTSVLVHGHIERNHNDLQIRVDEHEVIGDARDHPIHVDRIVPIYNLTEGLDARWLRELMWDALEGHIREVRDEIPSWFLEQHNLAPLPWALQRIHFPTAWADRDQARRRLAFEEFFFLELALARAREKREEGPPSTPCSPNRRLLTPFREAMSFEFTNSQRHVINEIFADMGRPKPMSRLLQGDVGSGKTVVALSAILLAAENGLQSVLMAPTEILAEQHFLTLNKFLKGLPVRWALFSRGVSKKERGKQAELLKSGEIHIAVGTHALIEEAVEFHRLGLVVIDEQHRFGVRQRARLQEKTAAPHVLIMTATPIPRTLALTLYGDLSISTIRELPPGRVSIATHWTLEENAIGAVDRAVKEGNQAYIVFPLVDKSEKIDLRAAVIEWEKLRTKIFPQYNVGLIHGRMKPKEKDETMTKFTSGEIQILVATPVVEVGIDVANATVMVVMHAERFGLAQLHQLRGRVGRGSKPSHCYVVSDPHSSDAALRMRLLCNTTDGFHLAEEDLKLRGPGEFLGEAQHGIPELKVGNLVKDEALIEEARQAAFAMLQTDPSLDKPAHHPFAEELARRFAGRLTFSQVA